MISRAGGGGVAAGASAVWAAGGDGGGPGGWAPADAKVDATIGRQIVATARRIHVVVEGEREGSKNIYGNSRMRRSRNSAHIGLPAWSWRARIPEGSASVGSSSVKSSVSRPFMK